MLRSIFGKILFWYLIIAGLLFMVLAFLGSYIIEKYLTSTLGEQYYAESMRIASDEFFVEKNARAQVELIDQTLEFVMGYQQSVIWITDPDGNLLIPDDEELPVSFSPEKIGLTYRDMAENGDHFIVGSFYDVFEENYLTVIAPVNRDNELAEYVVYHYPMARIYRFRRVFQRVLYLILGLIVLFGLIPLLIYQTQIQKPILAIKEGAMRYSRGDLDYHIPVIPENDIGYVAHSLNYMADHLRSNNEHQLRLLANVSHDFRSPLTSVKGYANAMLDGTIPPEQYDKYLGIISYEAERLSKLTQNLNMLNDLDSNRNALKREVFDINQQVRQIMASFEGISSRKQIRLSARFKENPLTVSADIAKIQRVIYNLLDNAIKFSGEGKEVVLSTWLRRGKVYVSVKDQGIGISKEDLDRIWERFYKTDASRGRDRKGSGLGLSIVQEIINAHGEQIEVTSTEGEGTEFIFTLPAAR